MTPRITDRPKQVLQLLCAGYSNEEIGARLHITQGTVKTHLRSLFNQLGANDRTHLVSLALTQGIIPLCSVVSKRSVER